MTFDSNQVVYLCSPNNPTGHTLDQNALSVALTKNSDTLFIVDEAYIEFSPTADVSRLIRDFENLIITRTFSKAWGLAAFRVGYIIACPTLIDNVNVYVNIKHVNALAKIAIRWSLQNPEYMLRYVERIQLNVHRLKEHYKSPEITVYNNFSGFILLEFDTFQSKIDHLQALRTKGIYIRDLGHLDGFEKFVRITVPYDIEGFINRII
jgi:histidinol-phosphate aminotransferase